MSYSKTALFAFSFMVLCASAINHAVATDIEKFDGCDTCHSLSPFSDPLSDGVPEAYDRQGALQTPWGFVEYKETLVQYVGEKPTGVYPSLEEGFKDLLSTVRSYRYVQGHNIFRYRLGGNNLERRIEAVGVVYKGRVPRGTFASFYDLIEYISHDEVRSFHYADGNEIYEVVLDLIINNR